MDISHLNKDEALKLKQYMDQATLSMETMRMEREHLKGISEVVETELNIDKKMFTKAVKLKYKGNLKTEEDTLEVCKNLLEQIDNIV